MPFVSIRENPGNLGATRLLCIDTKLVAARMKADKEKPRSCGNTTGVDTTWLSPDCSLDTSIIHARAPTDKRFSHDNPELPTLETTEARENQPRPPALQVLPLREDLDR